MNEFHLEGLGRPTLVLPDKHPREARGGPLVFNFFVLLFF
jgi:hypothetical protein